MTTIAVVLGVLAAAFVVALLAVLAVPVQVDLGLNTGLVLHDAPPRVRLGIQWLRWSWDSDDRRGRERRPRRSRPPRPRDERRRGGAPFLAALRSPGFALAVRRLAADLARALRPREAHGVVYVGLDDPAATGEFCGWLHAAAWSVCHDGALLIVPVFDEVRFEGRADLRWRVRPAAILRPIVAFGLTPAAWRGARAGWKARGAGPTRPGPVMGASGRHPCQRPSPPPGRW